MAQIQCLAWFEMSKYNEMILFFQGSASDQRVLYIDHTNYWPSFLYNLSVKSHQIGDTIQKPAGYSKLLKQNVVHLLKTRILVNIDEFGYKKYLVGD